jgi:hypothetical protein
MTFLGSVASVLLPWLAGWLMVHWRATPVQRPHWAVGAGYGYALGALLVTLLLRVLAAVGVDFTFWLPALLLVATGGFVLWRSPGLLTRTFWPARPRTLPGGVLRWLTLILALLIGVRFVALLLELLWRPLYPWDAWAQWATKARAWYEVRGMAPFVWPHEWLVAEGVVFTDPAPLYPATVPLLQVWQALAIGGWDESLVNLPWWGMGVALVLAFYGQLRSLGVARIAALAMTYLLASLPFLNTHVALAGYAELFVAGFYGLAAFAFVRWVESLGERGGRPLYAWLGAGDRQQLGFFLVFACALPFVKRPGLFWLLTFAAPLLVLLLPRVGNWLLLFLSLATVAALVILSETGARIAGYRLTGSVDIGEVARSLLENLFAMGNWHLLWAFFLAVLLLAHKQLWRGSTAAYTALIGAGGLFLGCVFFFSIAGDWVSDFTTVNRAIIHMVPVVVFYLAWLLFSRYRAWLSDDAVLLPEASGAGVPAQ